MKDGQQAFAKRTDKIVNARRWRTGSTKFSKTICCLLATKTGVATDDVVSIMGEACS